MLIEDEAQLMEAVRYVALNPYRAGLCTRPQDWQWSSYPASLGFVRPPNYLHHEWMRELFGSAAVLEKFVADGITNVPAPVPWQ